MITQLGYCLCGCGRPTRISTVNDKSKGWVKGRPLRYVKGHCARVLAKRGPDHYNWQGGRQRSSHGYVVIHCTDGKRRYEHTLVAQKILGRKLRSYGLGDPRNEVVHHIDGDKINNMPSNLLICTHEYHVALHHRLEKSAAWPEFQPVSRPGFGAER